MTEPFLDTKETPAKKRADGKVMDCQMCGLFKDCRSPVMKPYGDNAKNIMIVGEAPGEAEDDNNKPFQDKTGRMLGRYLKAEGIDMFGDCICVNSIRCRPEDNRTPTTKELECCRRFILQDIQRYRPNVIIVLGGSALQSVIGDRWKRDLGGITKWRGFTIPDQDFKAWVCPTFHPSYIAWDDTGAVEVVWEQDLKRIAEIVDTKVPRNKKPDIHILDDLSIFNNTNESTQDLIAFDIETTGLKPHATGHRIVCAAVAISPDKAYVFMMPSTPKERQPFLDLLTNRQIGKMAHNIKFEDTWCNVRLKTEVVNWEWDSMLAAHILDNRTGVTSLKFQTYVNFGVIDYSSEVYPYLRGTDWKNANSHNRVMELVDGSSAANKDHYIRMAHEIGEYSSEEKLLTYCAWDAIWEFRLAMKQIDTIQYTFLPF